MLTSFEAISLYAVLSGLSGLAIGSRVFPSARALRKAREDGRARGRGEIWRDAQWRVRGGQVYRMGQHGGPAWCDAGSQWDRDGANAYYGWEMNDEPRGSDRADAGELPDAGGGEQGRGGDSAGGPAGRPADDPAAVPPALVADLAPASADWADELSGMSVQIAVDDATETLAAVQPPPAPGTFEYYASERQQEFDQWLAGVQGELAAIKRELERSTA